MTCYRIRWCTTLPSEHKLKRTTRSSATDDSSVAIIGHVLNERGIGTTYDRKGSWNRLKVLSYSTKPPPVKRSSSGYSYGRKHIWCIWVLGVSVIVKISCISESVIVVWNSTCSAPCLLTIMLFGLKRSQEALWSYPVFHSLRTWRMGHFRVPPRFCIKTSAQPLIWKWFFILMQIKLIFTRKVGH